MYRLAPGHILQRLYLRERLRRRGLRTFVEVGAGAGITCETLLALGMTGSAFDLNAEACDANERLNAAAIRAGRFAVRREDFLAARVDPVDLVISSMVIEHLVAEDVRKYFARARALLTDGGLIVTVVPGSPRHWGIEDEVAGHQKRYVRGDFDAIAHDHGLRVEHVAGLTWPLSNLLLGVSNALVRRSESAQRARSAQERTVASGYRKVPGKTEFPDFVRLLVNDVTMYPWHVVQRMAANHPDALVLYAELARAA